MRGLSPGQVTPGPVPSAGLTAAQAGSMPAGRGRGRDQEVRWDTSQSLCPAAHPCPHQAQTWPWDMGGGIPELAV